LLKIDQLTKTYGNQLALQGLSLAIAPGEIYGLLGANGAGKTTTINILCNLLAADGGTVTIKGHPLSHQTKQWIGVAPQESLLYRGLTCAENLRFFGKLYGLRQPQLRQRVQDCLAAVGLSDRANAVAETLSGGMQRRLSLAIALIHQPQLLILDEPTTGLDLEARYNLWDLIRRLQATGTTILLTTHLLDEAERLCHRIGILKQGRLLVEGTLAQLQQKIPAQEVVLIKTSAEDLAIARAQTLELTHRRYGGELAFWLPQAVEMQELIHWFEGISIDAIIRQPVRLEHVYLEILFGGQSESRTEL
jgi:ABC-2 type transport system ATP-binding protein